MASSKKSKAEKKSKNGEIPKSPSKPRREDSKKKKKQKDEKKHKLSNGNVKKNDLVLIIPSSSIESLEEEAEKGHEIDTKMITNGRSSGTKPKKSKRKKEDEENEEEDARTDKFPMNRIRTIMKAEDPDLRVSEEAILLISKVTVLLFLLYFFFHVL